MDRKLAQRAAAAAQAGDLDAVRAAVAQDGAVARYWSLLMKRLLRRAVRDRGVSDRRRRRRERAVAQRASLPAAASRRGAQEDHAQDAGSHRRRAPAAGARRRPDAARDLEPAQRRRGGGARLHRVPAAAAGARSAAAGPVHRRGAGAARRSGGHPGRDTGRRHAPRRGIARRQLAATAILRPLRGRQRPGAGGHGRVAARPRRRCVVSVGLRLLVRQWRSRGTLLLDRGARLGDDDTVNHLACDGQVRRARPRCCTTTPST